MSKTRKSLLCALIVLCMVCALFPTIALANVDQTVSAVNADEGTVNDSVAVSVSGADATGVAVTATGGDAGVEVTGSVSATVTGDGKYDAYGVAVNAQSGNTATVGAGDVSAASSADDAVAVNVMTVGAGAEANVSAGSLTANSSDDGYGVSNYSSGASSSTIEAEGISVTAGYYGFGIDSDALNDAGGATSVEITSGDIQVDGSHRSYGVSVQSKNSGSGTAETTVTAGNISVTTDPGYAACGVYALAEGSGAATTVNAQNVYNFVELYAENGGETTLSLEGDVAGANGEAIEGAAIRLVPVGSASSIHVDVDGTINGETVGVGVKANQSGTADGDVDIRAWKIEVNSDDHVLGFVSDAGAVSYNDASETMERNILYYIKTDDPEGAALSAVDNSGNPLDEATEGTTVYLQVNVQEGYTVNGAFNGMGELVPLQQDASGKYYVEVERGGGVFLSVSVEKLMARMADGGIVPPLIIRREDGSVEVMFLTEKNGVAIEKTGEPDAAAMAILSQGLEGTCVYQASYAFTDELANRGKLQITFVLPGCEGQKVTVATIVNGEQRLYKNLYVANNGTVSILVDHVGDFAVFLG